MLNVPTMDKLRTLKFHGMLKALEEQMASSSYQRMGFEERLGLLVDQEMLERDNRRFTSRLRQASLRQQACVEDIDYSHKRGLDQPLLQSLYTCQWMEQKLNLLITGPTGVGKSFIACALGHQACRRGYRVKYYRIPRFLPQLAIAKGDGSYLKVMGQIAKLDLIILDDWGLSVLNDQQRHDLLEVLDDRHNRTSTIITSQIPVSQWHAVVGDPTIADAILDRVIHNAYTLELKGDSVRKKSSKLTKRKD